MCPVTAMAGNSGGVACVLVQYLRLPVTRVKAARVRCHLKKFPRRAL
jgi:hypothetical protein